ncbi:chromosome segregation protein [Halobacteriales archaeon QS_3_64_16]|nr:MAG: chromosome segregation protein [Halobacteriales archaeon QS_3_64_16]
MRFDRLTVKGYRCFEDADVRFEPGVTVVRGVNGVGKSSLLEACFFALYGAAALRTANATLEDVITTDAERCSVALWFTHAGGEYRVRRELKRSQDRASQDVAVLETPEGRFDQVRAVDDRIASLFRMDAESFLACAYVRQGEVNKLVEASPGERQDIIDGLVRLGVLETYRDRASQARLGVKHVRDSVAGALSDVTDQLEDKSEDELQAVRKRVGTQLEEIGERIEELREERETAAERKSEAEATIETQEEARAELADARKRVNDLEETIEETEASREDLEEELEDIDERIERAKGEVREALENAAGEGVDIAADAERAAIEDTHAAVEEEIEDVEDEISTTELRAEQAREQRADLEEEAEELDERAEKREQQAQALDEEIEEAKTAIEETHGEIESIDERIAEAKGRFEDAPIEFGEAESLRSETEAEREDVDEELTGITSELKATRKGIERAEDLREAGKCPTCGQDVEGSPHVHSLDEDREQVAELESRREELREEIEGIDERIERAEDLREVETTVGMLRDKREGKTEVLEGRTEAITDKKDQAERYREEASEASEEAEATHTEREERLEEVEAYESDLEALRERRAGLEERGALLETAIDAEERRSDLETERTRIEERHEHLGELLDERREGLEERRSRLMDLEEQVKEERVAEAKETKRKCEERIEMIDEDLEAAETRRDGLQNQRGRIESELEQLEELRERRADLEERAAALTSLYEECEALQGMYADLRADLRQRNIAALERLVNEVFDLAYRNDAYDRITLDGEYRATIHEKSGATLAPGKLSGGEQVLFNLALRCGIYQLLVEGAQGTAPMPPLILDEPTAHLDAGHIERIDGVVSRMREIGVEQTIVVSHTDELIDAADHRIEVTQRAATNRSEAHAESDLLV